MGSRQASCSLNKRKVKALKMRRQKRLNSKKVMKSVHGYQDVIHAPGPSNKKLRKDAKRRKNLAKYEADTLLKSGLISAEDIQNCDIQPMDE